MIKLTYCQVDDQRRIINEKLNILHFPDNTLLLKTPNIDFSNHITIEWHYENDAELFTIICLAKKAKSKSLIIPYIPHARMDRVKTEEDVFTLKYFADVINWLGFSEVVVLDPHSSVSEALINNITVETPKQYAEKVVDMIGGIDNLTMFYPDEGAMKRYSGMFNLPYAFGIKQRDWGTGEIKGLDVSGMTDLIKDRKILIVDDICSRGGTFYHSAKKLKELGAKEIYLYVSHCENTILDGEVLTSGLIERVFTTNSIFTKKHEKITVMEV